MSGRRFLLDTNIVIGIAKGPGPARDLLDQEDAAPAMTSICQITRIEVLSFPGMTVNEEQRLNLVMAVSELLFIDEEVEREAILMRRETQMKLPDCVIAATAVTKDLKLLTLDQRLIAGIERYRSASSR